MRKNSHKGKKQKNSSYYTFTTLVTCKMQCYESFCGQNLTLHQRWDNSDSGIGIGIGIDLFSSLMESESELNRNQNRNWNLTTVSGTGIGIGIECVGIVPSLLYTHWTYRKYTLGGIHCKNIIFVYSLSYQFAYIKVLHCIWHLLESVGYFIPLMFAKILNIHKKTKIWYFCLSAVYLWYRYMPLWMCLDFHKKSKAIYNYRWDVHATMNFWHQLMVFDPTGLRQGPTYCMQYWPYFNYTVYPLAHQEMDKTWWEPP